MLQHRLFHAKPRVFRAYTGMTRQEFEQLLPAFTAAYQAETAPPSPRQRRLGGGRKGLVPTMPAKLLFILVYLRIYPTQEVQGDLFGLSQAQAWEWIHTLLPVLRRALQREVALPLRPAASREEVQQRCPLNAFLLDATERAIQRPQEEEQQKAHYSGKKNAIRSKIPSSPPSKAAASSFLDTRPPAKCMTNA